jgi:hypothetical protein
VKCWKVLVRIIKRDGLDLRLASRRTQLEAQMPIDDVSGPQKLTFLVWVLSSYSWLDDYPCVEEWPSSEHYQGCSQTNDDVFVSTTPQLRRLSHAAQGDHPIVKG